MALVGSVEVLLGYGWTILYKYQTRICPTCHPVSEPVGDPVGRGLWVRKLFRTIGDGHRREAGDKAALIVDKVL